MPQFQFQPLVRMFNQLVKEEKSHITMVSRVRTDCDPEYAALTLEGSFDPFLYA